MAKTRTTGITKWSNGPHGPKPVSADVQARQVENHSERDFMRDLAKATQRKPKSS